MSSVAYYGATSKDEESLQEAKANLIISNKPNNSRANYYIAGIILVCVTFLATVTIKFNAASSASSLSFLSKSPKKSSDFAVSATNAYGSIQTNMFAYPFLDDAILLEPYKETTLTATSTSASATLSWSITGPDDDTLEADSGSVVSDSDGSSTMLTTLQTPGSYTLTVTETDGTTYTQNIVVKYVRRELTSLNDDDRDAFLDAFHTLWEVSTTEGMALYGSAYKSLAFFATIHNDAGANSVCDEFHGGVGFVNNHMLLSAYLEQSLQLVDPSTCLHYMEYSKYFTNSSFEDHIENQLDGGSWTTLLTDTFFGSSDPVTGRIIDGRWANATAPFMDAEFYASEGVDSDSTYFPAEESLWTMRTDAHLSSPYGLLRSPWNYNDDAYITRFNSVNAIASLENISDSWSLYYRGVTCTQYTSFLQGIYNMPMKNYLHYAEDDVHGIIHFTFGGAGGSYPNSVNAELTEDYGFNDAYLVVLQLCAQTFFKNIIPSINFPNQFEETTGVVMPLTCTTIPYNSTSYTVSDAGPMGSATGPSCSIASYYLESEDNLNVLVKYFFRVFNENQPQYEVVQYILDMSFEKKTEVMSLFMSRGSFDGEMAGSGAAQDPLFWVAHGAVERLLQKTIFSDGLSDYTYEEYTTERCSGHMSNGTKSWLSGFSLMDDSIDASELTNIDFMNILNPLGEKYETLVNFVYDSSSYSWCDDEDEWFTSAWDSVETGYLN